MDTPISEELTDFTKPEYPVISREGEHPSFRGYKEAAKAMLDKEYGWLECEKQKFKEGAYQKEEIA